MSESQFERLLKIVKKKDEEIQRLGDLMERVILTGTENNKGLHEENKRLRELLK